MSTSKFTKIASAIAGVGAVVALSACSSTPAPKAPVAEQTTPAQTDDAYMQAILVFEPEVANARPEAINLAHTECSTLDSGVPVETVLSTLLDNAGPFTPEQIGSQLGSAIRFYCPQYTDDAMSAANTAGA